MSEHWLIESKLPWFSNPEEPFPTRARRRRKLRSVHPSTATLELPSRDDSAPSLEAEQSKDASSADALVQTNVALDQTSSTRDVPYTPKPVPTETSLESALTATQLTPTSAAAKSLARVPVPIIPATTKATAAATTTSKEGEGVQASATAAGAPTAQSDGAADETAAASEATEPVPQPAPVRAPPKSWAELARRNAPPASATGTAANGAAPVVAADGRSKASSLAEAVRAFKVADATRVSFLEPRGLVNTGNMCYMNSVRSSRVLRIADMS